MRTSLIAAVLFSALISAPAEAGPRGRGAYRVGLGMSALGLAMGAGGVSLWAWGEQHDDERRHRQGGVTLDLGATLMCTGTLVSAGGVRQVAPNHGMGFGLGGLAGEIYMTPIGYSLCAGQMARNFNAVQTAGGWELGQLQIELVPVPSGLGLGGRF